MNNKLTMVALGILIFIGGIYAGQTSLIESFINTSPRLPQVQNAGLYTSVWNLIHTDYYSKKVNDENLLYTSIKGMVSSFNDPATLFLSPSDEKQFAAQTSGDTFAGVGLELTYQNNKVIVQRLIPSSPASSSIIKVGDEILSIDGRDVTSQDIDTVAGEIRGTTGTVVTIGVKDIVSGNSIAIKMTRQPIHVQGMYVTTTNTNGKKIDTFTISRFTEDTYTDWTSEWDTAIQQIVSDHPDGLVIDLRGNPGGFFDGAVYALSDFLPKNTLAAMQQDRNGTNNRFYTQTDPRIPANLKVEVLVNDNTASAAEIFSGAMQYYKRAILVGINTYGKGTAQQTYSFSDGSSLHLTVDHWLLPSGRWIQKSDPIHPDENVGFANADFLAGTDPQLAKALSDLQ